MFSLPFWLDWAFVIRGIRAIILHFGLGFGAGLLAYFLTLIILRCFGITLSSDPRIRPYLLGLSLSAAIASHVLQDYLWGLF
jgi:hypothetical protein